MSHSFRAALSAVIFVGGSLMAGYFFLYHQFSVDESSPEVMATIESMEQAMPKLRGLRRDQIEGDQPPTPFRGLASATDERVPSRAGQEGEISQDAWGSPLRYKVLPGTDLAPERILLWSAGRSGHFDTPYEEIHIQYSIREGFTQLMGDDFGYVFSL